MAVSSHFNAAAAMLIKVHGASAVYTQSGSPQTINVYIDKAFEVISDETGAGQFVKAAVIAKGDYPFSRYKVGDTIVQSGTTYAVTRMLQDDATYLVLEVK